MIFFKDYFSSVSADYAVYRPGYPDSIFEYLSALVPEPERAWDCACGNGQVAVPLSRYFGTVVATDASAGQIRHAAEPERISYLVAVAEQAPLSSASVSLVTVAQALHWFDQYRFFSEAKRILRPGGLIAVWCYGLFRCEPELDELVRDYYSNTLAGYWPPERRHIEQAYRSIAFPFAEAATPGFQMRAEWTLEQTLGYLYTWSASQRLIRAEGEQPFARLCAAIEQVWGDASSAKALRWPLSLRLGRR